jgi:hypothetical protein
MTAQSNCTCAWTEVDKPITAADAAMIASF